MACHLLPSDRDLIVRLFRADLYRRRGFIEFPHQAELRLASEGMALTSQVVDAPDEPPKAYDPAKISASDYVLKPTPVPLLVPCLPGDPEARPIGETGNYAKTEWRMAVPRSVQGVPGPAHKLTDLAAFKAGKSKSAGMWVAPFAILPGATIELVGKEYKTSEHEYAYLVEALLSGKDAPFKKYKHLYQDVKAGRMFLELNNNCTFEVRSWENKDTLRGGQMTVYLYNEIYQLPGLEVFTGQAQNLRVEKGYAYFTSTPDKPWVKVLHEMGHGKNPDWHCTCGSNGMVNPISFSLPDFMADAPDWETIQQHAPDVLPLCLASGLQPGRLMSQEKFLISHLGRLGQFVGRVYAFQEGQHVCYPDKHPHLFKPSVVAAWTAQQAQIAQLRGGVEA